MAGNSRIEGRDHSQPFAFSEDPQSFGDVVSRYTE